MNGQAFHRSNVSEVITLRLQVWSRACDEKWKEFRKLGHDAHFDRTIITSSDRMLHTSWSLTLTVSLPSMFDVIVHSYFP